MGDDCQAFRTELVVANDDFVKGISELAASVKRPRHPITTFKNKYEKIN